MFPLPPHPKTFSHRKLLEKKWKWIWFGVNTVTFSDQQHLILIANLEKKKLFFHFDYLFCSTALHLEKKKVKTETFWTTKHSNVPPKTQRACFLLHCTKETLTKFCWVLFKGGEAAKGAEKFLLGSYKVTVAVESRWNIMIKVNRRVVLCPFNFNK